MPEAKILVENGQISHSERPHAEKKRRLALKRADSGARFVTAEPHGFRAAARAPLRAAGLLPVNAGAAASGSVPSLRPSCLRRSYRSLSLEFFCSRFLFFSAPISRALSSAVDAAMHRCSFSSLAALARDVLCFWRSASYAVRFPFVLAR